MNRLKLTSSFQDFSIWSANPLQKIALESKGVHFNGRRRQLIEEIETQTKEINGLMIDYDQILTSIDERFEKVFSFAMDNERRRLPEWKPPAPPVEPIGLTTSREEISETPQIIAGKPESARVFSYQISTKLSITSRNASLRVTNTLASSPNGLSAEPQKSTYFQPVTAQIRKYNEPAQPSINCQPLISDPDGLNKKLHSLLKEENDIQRKIENDERRFNNTGHHDERQFYEDERAQLMEKKFELRSECREVRKSIANLKKQQWYQRYRPTRPDVDPTTPPFKQRRVQFCQPTVRRESTLQNVTNQIPVDVPKSTSQKQLEDYGISQYHSSDNETLMRRDEREKLRVPSVCHDTEGLLAGYETQNSVQKHVNRTNGIAGEDNSNINEQRISCQNDTGNGILQKAKNGGRKTVFLRNY